MQIKHPRVLILGAGSVGQRHLGNFANQGCVVSIFDPRRDRLEAAVKIAPVLSTVTSIEELGDAKDMFDGVVVASPPSFHVEQLGWALDRGLPVLMEKPLGISYDSACAAAKMVQEKQGSVVLGYTYRWWEPLRDFRDKLRSSEIGRPIHVQCFMSAHLADWHPWEHYKEFFMASATLGGGALLDESHFIDLLLWMFGMPKTAFGCVSHISNLDIETDDNVDAILEFPDGLRASVHLDLYGRPHEKWINVICDNGTMRWSFEPNEIRISSTAEQSWKVRSYSCVRNEMFVACAKEFIDLMSGNVTDETCTIADGVNALKVIEALRRSEISGHKEII